MPIQAYRPENIRNVAIVGHGHAGKTALAEAILFDEGATTRLGSTQDNTSIFDTEPEEVHRGGSIASHFGWVEHAGKKVNLIDTPGDQNFFLDGLTALLGTDSIVAVVSSVDGVQLQTKRAWSTAVERKLSRLIFVNKMDRCPSDWKGLVERIGTALHTQPVMIQIPIGTGEGFKGVVDLLTKNVFEWPQDGSGKAKSGSVPSDLEAVVKEATENMIESIVSTDDALLEKYLDTGDVSSEELQKAFVKAVQQCKLVPVLFGSATCNMGIQPLLEILADVFPSPIDRGPIVCKDSEGNDVEIKHNMEEPFLAQVIHTSMDDHAGQISVIRVFSGELPKDGQVNNSSTKTDVRLGTAHVLRGKERTPIDRVICGDIVSAVKLKDTHTNNTLTAPNAIRVMPEITYPQPMIGYVLVPKAKKDDDRLKESIQRLMEEDPTLSTSIDELTHRLIISGMGHAHLENAIERLKRKYHVEVDTDLPTIAYRETISKSVQEVEGKHKKQSGGAGQFGVCFINVEPLPRGGGFEFVNKIRGGSIPKQYIPSVEKGVIEKAQRGFLAGYPLIDFRVTLIDGKYHPVDSKDIAYQLAGSKALKTAMDSAGLKLLEPCYKMEIVVPVENSGDVIGDITSRRGQMEGMNTVDEMAVISAICPLAEVQRYVPDLRAMTGGRGTFVMEFDSYREVPGNLVDKIRENSPLLKDKEKAAGSE